MSATFPTCGYEQDAVIHHQSRSRRRSIVHKVCEVSNMWMQAASLSTGQAGMGSGNSASALSRP
jgi:hypothetical protein